MPKKWGKLAILMMVAGIAMLLWPVMSIGETLVWNPSSGTVEGYIVYWGRTSNDRSNSRDVGASTRCDLNSLPLSEGVTYYLSVSAYNQTGKSVPCSPVVFTPGDNTPPLPPAGLTQQ